MRNKGHERYICYKLALLGSPLWCHVLHEEWLFPRALFMLGPGLGAIISFIYSFIYLFSFILPLHTVLVNKSFKPSLMLISGDTRASEAQGSPFHGLP